MKKVNAFLVMLISAFFLTGCMRFNTTITVKSNGKLDVSMLYAMVDMSDYGYDEDYITESEVDEYKDRGWDVEDYDEDGFKGYTLTKKDITAEELSSSMEDTQSELYGENSSINFTRQGLKYTLDWQVFDKEQGEQLSAYKNYFSMSGGYMKITVNLPVKPLANNATYVSDDGKTLEWDLLNLEPDQNIHLEYALINIWPIIGLCVLATIVIVAIVVVVVVSSKKRKKAQMPAGGFYQQPQDVASTAYNPTQYQQPQYQAETSNLVADELVKMKKLLDDGVISQEEFDAQKAKLLNNN